MCYSLADEPFRLATRTYWDVYGAEAESMTLEEKLKTLGRFVQEGGDITNVVELYVDDDREDPSQLEAVQWAIFDYLEYMINGRESLQPNEYSPTALRIMRLEKEELLELLEKELKRWLPSIIKAWPPLQVLTAIMTRIWISSSVGTGVYIPRSLSTPMMAKLAAGTAGCRGCGVLLKKNACKDLIRTFSLYL